MSVKVTFYGDVKKQTNEDGCRFNSEGEITIEETFTDPVEFHNFTSNSATSMAEKILPDNYYILNDYTDNFDVRLNINAVTATEWAEIVAEEKENKSRLDILTYWLQVFGSMRIRRAIHTILDKEGVDVSSVG